MGVVLKSLRKMARHIVYKYVKPKKKSHPGTLRTDQDLKLLSNIKNHIEVKVVKKIIIYL